jgi:uncharacterized protein involved in response to NO
MRHAARGALRHVGSNSGRQRRRFWHNRRMLNIEDSKRSAPAPVPGGALWALGFRPFYLCASAFAALSVALWAAEFSGHLSSGYVHSPIWHAHEMLFGFTLAVVAGFLFTAVRNWTGHPTPTGPLLMAIVALWVAGRVLVAIRMPVAAAVVNAAFPIAVAAAIAVPLVRAGNRRNYFFLALLVILGAAQAGVHATYLGLVAWEPAASLQIGIDIVLLVITVMGGRVIPMFTNNGIPGTAARRDTWIEAAALGSTFALLLGDLAQVPEPLRAAVLTLAAAAHARRLWLWQPWRTRRTPLVWILHAAYAWIVVHLVLRLLADHEVLPASLALHAFTMGAVGGMTLGMMVRTARGHTGRPLVADAHERGMFMLVALAPIVRVAGGALVPEALYLWTVGIAAACWAAAFGWYTIRYAPILTRPRADGKPG